jgi:NAD(P)-dependent dehydrogenase (short-subunit alcohol dehydrogenase family)
VVSDQLRFQGQVVVVTGAAQGIGLAVAQALAEEGADLIVIDCDERALSEAVLLERRQQRVRRVVLDVTDHSHYALAMGHLERVDVLINNAGVNEVAPLEALTAEQIVHIVHKNLLAAVHLTRFLLPALRRSPNGCIVNIASRLASLPVANNAVYASSKAGIVSFTKQLAVELGPAGIRVNCVSPGLIRTRMNEATRNDSVRKQAVLSRQCVARIGEPVDVAHAVSFLAGRQASFLTGVDLAVDGGLH